ncbi:MAG TPA: hypothetical protein DHV14_10285 [Micrococcales bacterium]|uniref:Uncharacterized protein n=1 Tax=Miniimonas arenae TaxID=676201 RepID=A0A5C5BBA6_9MICO|nr:MULTISPECIES: hypothetical protein [Miniimonas]TNU74079.1 hypothetical protein FH969_08010 [Miniimonas arenae]HCX85497.1 hypothetical protein [Micrococcales bacterium]
MSATMKRWLIGFAVLDVVLFATLLVLLVSQGPGGSDDADATATATSSSTPAAGATDGTDASPAPSADATASGTQEFTPPEGALALADFTLPSRNISCALTDEQADCWIAEATFTPPAGDACEWRGQLVVMTSDGVAMPCPDAAPGPGADGVAVLEYGQTTVVGPWMCTSSDSGLECSSLADGTGFTLARASFTSYGPGRLA